MMRASTLAAGVLFSLPAWAPSPKDPRPESPTGRVVAIENNPWVAPEPSVLFGKRTKPPDNWAGFRRLEVKGLSHPGLNTEKACYTATSSA